MMSTLACVMKESMLIPQVTDGNTLSNEELQEIYNNNHFDKLLDLYNIGTEACSNSNSNSSTFNDSLSEYGVWSLCNNEEMVIEKSSVSSLDDINTIYSSSESDPMADQSDDSLKWQELDQQILMQIVENLLHGSECPIKENDQEVNEETTREKLKTNSLMSSPRTRKQLSKTRLKLMREKRKYVRRKTDGQMIQLWEFLLALLEANSYHHLIKWVSLEEGIFRLMKPEKVGYLWGTYKKTKTKSYNSLSRALRHYYVQGILEQVPRKLHYKFTEQCINQWKKTNVEKKQNTLVNILAKQTHLL